MEKHRQPSVSTTGKAVQRGKQRPRFALLPMLFSVCASVIPLGASSVSTAQNSAAQDDLVVRYDSSDFERTFAETVEPLSADNRNAQLNLPSDAVDLSSFEPPIETAPPEPEAGSVVRSLGNGVASYYGRRFHGRLTANGERFNMNAMTAAHKTLPFGTLVRVTNPRNGRSVTVRINDRGPFVRGRTIDLSRAAAERIGLIALGHGRVELAVVR